MTRQPGGLTIEAGVGFGLIRVVGVGFWTPSMIDAHFDELAAVIAPYRTGGAGVRILVDIRQSGLQSEETILRMQDGVRSVTQAGDRTAIVVSSSLAKMQMRKTIGSDQHQFFVSPEAARTWVEAY